jgi:hypothetical protein
MGWQGRAAPTDAHDVGRRQILRNAPLTIRRYLHPLNAANFPCAVAFNKV